MSKQIKALLLDIDGVILNKETDTNPNLWVKLNEIKGSGVPVSFLTSRPYAFCTHILDKFDSASTHVFDCGGYILNTADSSVNHSAILSYSLIEKLVAYFKQNDPQSKFGLSVGKNFYTNARYLENLNNYMPTKTVSLLPEQTVENANSVWIRDALPETAEFVNDAAKGLDIIFKSYEDEGKHSMFILPKEATKLNGAKILSQATGLDLNDAMYIADEDSDIEVLKEVGYAACPANASENVKEVCAYISPLEYSKGIIKVLNESGCF